VPSFFERVFGKKEKKKPEPAGGEIEVFRPARPPSQAGDIFSILAPPSGGLGPPPALPGPRSLTEVLVPGSAPEAPAFQFLTPTPAKTATTPSSAPARPATLTEAFFPEGVVAPLEERRAAQEPGLFDIFSVKADPVDLERAARGIPSRKALDRMVNLGDILGMVEEGRQEPAFRKAVRATLRGGPPAELPLLRIASGEQGAAEKVSDFLGVPRKDLEALLRSRQDPWRALLNPLLYEVERGLEWYLGAQIPGTFRFGVNDRDEFGLFYLEDHPDL
jgi:hypothetical protein